MKMPWGKHEGTEIEDIPSSYLMWLMENCDDEEIVGAAEEEYEYRDDEDEHFE